jgi:hypothetical protein
MKSSGQKKITMARSVSDAKGTVVGGKGAGVWIDGFYTWWSLVEVVG